MIGKSCYQNFKAVGQIQTELHILKLEKLDSYIRPLFTNPVTYGQYTYIYFNLVWPDPAFAQGRYCWLYKYPVQK